MGYPKHWSLALGSWLNPWWLEILCLEIFKPWRLEGASQNPYRSSGVKCDMCLGDPPCLESTWEGTQSLRWYVAVSWTGPELRVRGPASFLTPLFPLHGECRHEGTLSQDEGRRAPSGLPRRDLQSQEPFTTATSDSTALSFSSAAGKVTFSPFLQNGHSTSSEPQGWGMVMGVWEDKLLEGTALFSVRWCLPPARESMWRLQFSRDAVSK